MLGLSGVLCLALLGAPATTFSQAAAAPDSDPPTALLPERPLPPGADPRAADTAFSLAQRLADEGRPEEALAAIEPALKSSPSDARLRFLKGVLLGGQGKDAEAIAIFQGLARQFPELPEPHNNLAALLAARGELDLARNALDEAIRALPSYALAHENLGDLYLRLAMRAWQRAVELEPANAAAARKLKLSRELAQQVSPPPPASRQLPGGR